MSRPARRAALGLAVLAALAEAGCAAAGAPARRALPEAGGTDTIRILAYNIHHAEGMDGALDLARIAALIRQVDPDVATIQEVDSVTTRTGRIDQAAELGRLTGMQPAFGRFMPYRGGAYGMAVLTRWPVERVRNLRLPDGEEPRTALSVIVRTPRAQRRLRVVGIHLYATETERLAQALRLDEALRDEEIPTILAGDFNSTPGSRVMRKLAGSWHIVDKGADHLTFPSYGPEREIDYVLLRPDTSFEVLRHRLRDEPVASDHRPLVIDLVVR